MTVTLAPPNSLNSPFPPGNTFTDLGTYAGSWGGGGGILLPVCGDLLAKGYGFSHIPTLLESDQGETGA